MTRQAVFGALLLALIVPGTTVSAQAPLDSARARACATAHRIAARGLNGEEPAEEGDRTPRGRRMDRAWNLLQSCGRAGGVVAGAAWRQLRTVSDTAQLNAMYNRVWSFRDASVFNAATTLAADPAATKQARVFSLMLLTTELYDDWNPDYRQFVSTTQYRVCPLRGVIDRSVVVGSPLPTNARAQARTLAQSLATNASAPAEVQSGGRCLAEAIDTVERIEAAGPIVPPGL